MFRIIQGHQITDEEIYNTEGDIPILTGQNQIKGYWNKQIVNEEDLPCITYPTKANSGVAYIQDKIFDANNTAILIPFPEWRKKIDLEWFCYKLSVIFPKIQTSKKGVSYLNKEIVEELEINVPLKELQLREKKSLIKILTLKKKLEKIISKIDRLKSSLIEIEYKSYQSKNVPAKKLFRVISGNSGLTEEYIYSLIFEKGEKKYKILTGSINIKNLQKIHLCKHPKNSARKINVFSGEGIHIVRKGKAGYTNYLSYGEYTLNDDAYILALKDNIEYEISLKWFINTYSHVFFEYASKSDNGTWNKTSFLKYATFDIPSFAEQMKILKKFERIDEYKRQIEVIHKKIDEILNKEIISEIPEKLS